MSFVGLVGIPLGIVALSVYFGPGGETFSPASLPFEVLLSPPSPTQSGWLQWNVAPRDILISLDLERLALAYAISGALLPILNRISPNEQKEEPDTDPRKAVSKHERPGVWFLAAAALHITAMRVLALRSVGNYAAAIDGKYAGKHSGPPFGDVGAMVGGVLGFLLAFRELGNLADRMQEFANLKAHRNSAQVGHVVTGTVRFLLAIAMFRRCVVSPPVPQ